MNFPLSRYTFYRIPKENTIKAVMVRQGKRIEGKARCHPEEEFNEEFGMQLAAIRCEKRAAKERYKIAYKAMKEAEEQREKAMRAYEKAWRYYANSSGIMYEAALKEEQLLAKFEDKSL